MAYFSNSKISIINEDILTTSAIKSNSVDLIVTSPPYNVGIQYGSCSSNDNISYSKYLDFTRAWLLRCFDFLKDDGRICVNIAIDTRKNGYQSTGADVTTIAKQVGFQYYSTIVWNKRAISTHKIWGTWMSAKFPCVISPVELILVFYKKYQRKTNENVKSDMTESEFINWTNGLWTFNGENRQKIGHPAPFPIELPRRCIKLFSFVGDTVFDPFAGSGTTLIAAAMLDRIGIGVEINPCYCEIAKKRILSNPEVMQTHISVEETQDNKATRQ